MHNHLTEHHKNPNPLIKIPIKSKNYIHSEKNLKYIGNKELLSQMKLLVQKERHIHIQILHHLREIQSRKLYLTLGFSSLFDYAVKELGYSEGAAFRRIKTMKLCQDIPETEVKLQSGKLSLSSACQLQTFFEKQKKARKDHTDKALKGKSKNTEKPEESSKKEPALTSKESLHLDSVQDGGLKNKRLTEPKQQEALFSHEEKKELIKKIEGKSTRDTMKLLSEISSSVSITQREQVRFLGNKEVELKVVIDEECYKRLEELKHLLSHKDPNLSYEKLLSIISNESLKKHDPCQRNIRRKVSKNSTPQKPSVKTKTSQKSETSRANFSAPKNHCVKSGSNNNLLKTKFLKNKPSINKSLIYKRTPAQNTDKTNQIKTIQQYTRYIPPILKKQIWERDKGQCTYIHRESGRQCGSRHFLQIDHIQPFSLGGRTEFKNLRLLCAGHNQFRNEKIKISSL